MSLASRLALSNVLICTASVALGIVLLGVHGAGQVRDNLHARMVRTASIVGPNAATALAFEDVVGALAVLQTLESDPEVAAGRIYRSDGSAFATYHAPRVEIDLPGYAHTGEIAEGEGFESVNMPITMSGETVGFLILVGHRKAIDWTVARQGLGAAVLLIPVALASFFLSLRIRRTASKPIRKVTDCIRHASSQQDRSFRVPRSAERDLGDLVDECNGLLDHMAQREQELSESRAQLDELVQLRTAEQKTANQELKTLVDQLKEAKKAAETANRTKSQFLARMSHEIRTPMNGVMGMTDLLIQSGLTSRQQGLAETVYRSGEALLHIINDILDFSKIEAGKLDLCNEEFNVHSLVQDVLELMAEPTQGKGLELIGMIDETVPSCMIGDPLRLRQILVNLIGNAVKFTSSGEVIVRCKALHEAHNNVVVKFEVQDTGIGIDPEAVERIFDPFSQADGTTTRKYGGTGLGLAICKQLTLMMGGDVGASSEIGRGSVFWFTACFQDPVQPADHPEEADRALESVPILVLSPNRTLCDQIRRMLVQRGADVRMADEIDHAIHHLQISRTAGAAVRVIVADSAAGFDQAILRGIRKDPESGETRVVALKDFAPDAGANDAGERPDGSVRKPVRETVLYRTVAEAIGEKTSADVADARPQRKPGPGPGICFDADVLVAEDNAVNQEVARGMLAQFGCRVTIAANGRQAVELAGRRSFDIVFMDCQMPEMDGFDATRAIRKFSRPGNSFFVSESEKEASLLPIVALTANAMEGDREMCLARGMDDYMSKPFTTSQLGEVLRKWLPHRVVSAPEPAPVASGPRAPSPPEGIEPVKRAPRAAADEDGGATLDARIIQNIIGVQQAGAEGLFERVVQSYLVETPKLIEEVRRAVADHDPRRLKLAAHSLKSSSANVGARALARHCKDLEALDHEELNRIGGEFAAQVESAFEAVKLALHAELEAAAT